MPEPSEKQFSDDEASRIWRRAAELQAQRRLPVVADQERTAETPAEVEEHRLSSAEVLSVAREAGIDPEFVEQAITEATFAPVAPDARHPEIGARRTVSASVETVITAVQEVAEREPFRLRLVDLQRTGAVHILTFELGARDWSKMETTGLRAGELGAGRNVIAVRALVRPGDAAGSTELILHGVPNPNLPKSVRFHDVAFGGMGAAIGGVAGYFGGALALSGAVLAAPLAAGALAVGAAGVGVMRATQNWARRADAASLDRLANEIVGAAKLRTQTRHLSHPQGQPLDRQPLPPASE